MIKAFSTSRSTLNAMQNKLDAISANIANIGTTGYKKLQVNFKDLLNEKLNKNGIPINDKNSIIGTGVKSSDLYKNQMQGQLQETNRYLDLAIDGKGYFKVVDENGLEYYTRDGNFSLDKNNNIVDAKGNILEIKFNDNINKNILSNNNLQINKDGTIHITTDETNREIGKIATYNSIGVDSFIPVGDNLNILNPESEIFETNDRDIYQGFLENSNVDITEEFTEMIMTQRAFQLGSKGLQTADEMWGMINNLRS